MLVSGYHFLLLTSATPLLLPLLNYVYGPEPEIQASSFLSPSQTVS